MVRLENSSAESHSVNISLPLFGLGKALFLVVGMLLATLSYAADFNFRFEGVDPTFGDHGRADLSCNMPGRPDSGCPGSGNNDPTPFLMEYFEHEGVTYYHLQIGLPEDGFAQEVFIKAGGESYTESTTGSSSLGDGGCRLGIQFTLAQCSASDPLGFNNDNTFTGNGSGNPMSVAMFQLMGGTWNDASRTWSCAPTDPFCHSFLKSNEENKPQLLMTLREFSRDFETHFEMDMSNSNYLTDSIAGEIIATTIVNDPEFEGHAGAGDFDYATDASVDSSEVTAGRYIFTATSATDASLNPYAYASGGDFTLDQDWTIYYDPLQN